MIESAGGESIKGMTVRDEELIEVGRERCRGARRSSARQPSSASAPEPGLHEVTDVNLRFGGAFPLPLAAGSAYPALALALARASGPQPRLGDYRRRRRHDALALAET